MTNCRMMHLLSSMVLFTKTENKENQYDNY